MNITGDLKQLDERSEGLANDFVQSSEKMAHKETFWMAVAISLIVLGLIVLTIFGQSGPEAVEAHPFIFIPMY
ncbi:MAG: hypothetical protein WCE45_06305 [Sedimentisphaerales bacterium]